jgi:hypothetical protein
MSMDYDSRPELFKKIMTEAGEPTTRKDRHDSDNAGCLTILISFIFIIIGLIVAINIGAQYISTQ